MERIKIEDLGINGEGIAHRENGKTIFISGSLPSEIISVKDVIVGKNFDTANVEGIIHASQHRQIPICPHFLKCGGCNLQHLDHKEELKFKTKLVMDTLKKVGGIEVDVLPCVKSEQLFYYRNKATFYCNGNVVGMLKPQSHEIVDIDTCHIANKNINHCYSLIKSFLQKQNDKIVSSFTIREFNNQFLITLSHDKMNTKKYQELGEFLRNSQLKFGLFFKLSNRFSFHNFNNNNLKYITGLTSIKNCEFGINYEIKPDSFLQVNNDIKGKLYEQVLKEVDSNDIVLDAYSGAGLMSAIISKKAKQCYAVELNKEANEICKQLIADNNICNLENIEGDCSKILSRLLPNIKFDTIILDPPKKGCDKEVLNQVIKNSPKKIIFIACSPIKLATNLKVLLSSYRIKYIQPYDMFPQTCNIETLVVLEKI